MPFVGFWLMFGYFYIGNYCGIFAYYFFKLQKNKNASTSKTCMLATLYSENNCSFYFPDFFFLSHMHA